MRIWPEPKPQFLASLGMILLLSVSPPCSAQQSTCVVPVSVIAPDLSMLPKADADLIVERWKEYSAKRKATTPRTDLEWFWQGSHYVDWLGGSLNAEWELVQTVPADGFVARDGKRLLHIQDVRTDSSARRIVLVVENGRRLDAEARKAEAAVISYLLSKARAEDSLGLLTEGGPTVAMPLGTSRDTLREAAEGLGATGESSQHEGVLDAVLTASTWLKPRHVGDCIFLICQRVEGGNRTSFSKVQRALGASGIRVFGEMLGPSYAVETQNSDLSFTWYYPKMFALVGGSGGLAFGRIQWEPPRSGPKTLEQLRQDSELMYNAAAQFYALRLDLTGTGLTIDLASQIRDRMPLAKVLYPHHLMPCPSASSPSPASTVRNTTN
jgi:hypothetical protein